MGIRKDGRSQRLLAVTAQWVGRRRAPWARAPRRFCHSPGPEGKGTVCVASKTSPRPQSPTSLPIFKPCIVPENCIQATVLPMLPVPHLLILFFLTLSPSPIKAADPPPPEDNIPVRRYNSDFGGSAAVRKGPFRESTLRSSSVENLSLSAQFSEETKQFISEQNKRIEELQRRLEKNKNDMGP